MNRLIAFIIVILTMICPVLFILLDIHWMWASWFMMLFILLPDAIRALSSHGNNGGTQTTGTRRVRQDLSAVEASVLLEYPQDKVIKMIIHVLLGENVLRLIMTRPLKFEITNQQVELKYWEQQLIQAIRADGTLDREALSRIYSNIRRGVSLKMQEYNVNSTKNHYRNRVEQRMEQIEASLRIQLEG